MRNSQENIACDKAIIEIAQGNREELAVIYDCMARMIFAVTYSITGNYSDAEDALQDTMIQIVKYSNTYKSGTNARAWILKMARHISIDIVRKRKNTISIDNDEITKIPDNSLIYSQIEVLEMLSVLNEEEKQLIIYRLYIGMSYAEISGIMNIGIYAAQKRYQRAVKKLRKHWSIGGDWHEKE